jgi:A/G-specific adenine glycosylase
LEKKQFLQRLYEWHEGTERNLPWKETKDPYKIWLSEVILQQTRVEQGLPYYERFIKKYPSIHSLANARDDDFMSDWEGLGYYSRARNVLKSARMLSGELNGIFPTTYSEIIKLPGIGPYSASAISSFAFSEARAVVDGNVLRVFSRLFAIYEPVNQQLGFSQVKQEVDRLLDEDNPGAFNQAIMDFGALQCSPRKPDCSSCPFTYGCVAYKEDLVAQLPIKRKPQARRKRYFIRYWLEHDGKVTLSKQTKKDVWQDLYLLPGHEVTEEIFAQGVAAAQDLLYTGKQVLSHQEIFVAIYSTDQEPLDPNEIVQQVEINKLKSMALPKIFRSFVNSYLEDVNL